MANYRVSRYLLSTYEFLGSGETERVASHVLTSISTGQHLEVGLDDLDLLRRLCGEGWVSEQFLEDQQVTPERLNRWVRLGILLSDAEEDYATLPRVREGLLEAGHWPPFAAVFHLMNHHQESRLVPFGKVFETALGEEQALERAASFLELHGTPPPAFVARQDRLAVHELPMEIHGSDFTEILLRRRTCRRFAPDEALKLADLSSLLRGVFGAWAERGLSNELRLLLKTSPSGGSLHPVEAYPILFCCEKVACGVYHYQAETHSLELLREMSEADLRRLCVFLAEGQSFVGSCAALFVLVARFDRNFWKYRERENSYAVVLQDAGHLSQTFQLMATDLGLGAFYTAAINSEAISDILGLPYPAEAPLGILGVGRAAEEASGGVPARPFNPQDQRR